MSPYCARTIVNAKCVFLSRAFSAHRDIQCYLYVPRVVTNYEIRRKRIRIVVISIVYYWCWYINGRLQGRWALRYGYDALT